MSAFLAIRLVPALAAAGAALALFPPRRAPDRAVERAAFGLAWLLVFVHSAAATVQELRLGAAPLRAWAVAACAACAWFGARAAARALARGLDGRTAARTALAVLLPLAFVPVLTLAVGAFRSWPAPAAALLIPASAAGAAAATLALAAWTAAAPSRRKRAAAGAVLALLAVGIGWRSARARPAMVVDRPQPAAAPEAGGADLPNVVLIVLDTVRASNLSCYGYARRTTPSLDAFAARAVRFTGAATVSPWSVPSHASLFTGLFPTEHGAGRGVRDADGLLRPAPLPDGALTLAEALSARGYATAGISANPLVAPPMNMAQGFRYFDARRSPASLTPLYVPLLSRLQGHLPAALVGGPLKERFSRSFRSAAEITDAAMAWLGRGRPPRQPYLLFLNYMDAHTPWASPPGFRHRWPGRSARLPSYGLPTAGDVVSGRRPMTAEERDHMRALYDDALSYLDQEVGRLLAFLEGRPDAGRTAIIVTADHGEALGEHDRLGHNCVLYEQVLHVPLIVRYPAAFPRRSATAPAVDPRPMPLVRIVPLVLSLAGTAAAEPEAPGGREARAATVECFSAEDGPPALGSSGAALVSDNLKYVEEVGRPPLLFDLDHDPEESRDLAAERPADAERLRVELARWRRGLRAPSAGAAGGAAGTAGLTDRDDALRALGYVQ